MSLVAYGSSDESETEYEDTGETHGEPMEHTLNLNLTTIQSDSENKLNDVMFNSLPIPKYHSFNLNGVNFNRQDKRIKISIPSLDEFNDEEEIEEEVKPKRIKPSTKGSGLISMLPAPKNEQIMKPPQVLSNKSSKNSELNSATSEQKMIPHILSKKVQQKSKTIVKQPDSSTALSNSTVTKSSQDFSDLVDDGNDGEDINNDFFSLSNDADNVALIPSGDDFCKDSKPELLVDMNRKHDSEPQNINVNVCINQKDELKDSDLVLNEVDRAVNHLDQVGDSEDLAKPKQLPLDNDALEKLCGRGNTRRNKEEIQLIDVNEDSILSDSKLLLAKQLTEETTYRSSHKKKDGPSSVQKRKHQITYLAYEAKEREMELKNQWANNKLTKKQTQAKYGF